MKWKEANYLHKCVDRCCESFCDKDEKGAFAYKASAQGLKYLKALTFAKTAVIIFNA
jgi:hypothetical protein